MPALLNTLIYIALWLLSASAVTLVSRLLRTHPARSATEPLPPPIETEPADAGRSRALAGLMVVIALLVLAWSVLPAAPETVAAAGVPLIVLIVLLLHLRRHTRTKS